MTDREVRIRELRGELARMAAIDPGLVLAALVDALIEAVTAASVMGNRHLLDIAKEQFYGRLIRELSDRRPW